MRITPLGALLLAASFAACRPAQTIVVPPAVEIVNPGTNIYGEWTLGMDADSTGFLGARAVDLTLRPGTFTIVAMYATGEPLTIAGDASRWADSLRLTLYPRSISGGTNGSLSHPSPFTLNEAVTLMASAVGKTLVFTRPDRTEPTSVWHRRN